MTLKKRNGVMWVSCSERKCDAKFDGCARPWDLKSLIDRIKAAGWRTFKEREGHRKGFRHYCPHHAEKAAERIRKKAKNPRPNAAEKRQWWQK